MVNIQQNSNQWADFDHNLQLFIKRKETEKLTWKKIDKFCNWACMESNNHKICWKWCRNKINSEKEYFYKKLDAILSELY